VSPTSKSSQSNSPETMDPRLLRYLRIITETGTYREAAERLRVTQPMLTKSMQQLERRLGVKVLTRGRHGAAPTVFGAKLVAWSKRIDTELSKMLQDIEDIKGTRVGHVRIGASPPLTTRLMPQVISRLKAKHPGILVGLREQSSLALTQALLAGDYDLVIGGIGLEPLPPNVEEEFLFSSASVAFVGRRHPLSGRRKVSLKDLCRYPWASPTRSSIASTELTSMITSAGIERLEASIETDSFPTLRMLLQDGEHFVVNSTEVFADEVHHGRLVAIPIKEKAIVWRFGLQRRKDSFETPAMRVFTDILRSTVHENVAS
jgi:DNA-binding transcriptional LysR family regulator